MTKLEKLRREYDPTPEEQISDLRAERDALAERLRQTPEVREIIGQIRTARDWLADGAHSLALKRLNEVLRQLDESQ